MPEILIVDDLVDNLNVLKLLLEEHFYTVRIAKNGAEAVQSVSLKVPDLILMDINMPEMDGIEATRRIKAQDKAKNVPIIFVTAFRDIEHTLSAFSSGGVDYVTKPFNSEEVMARVNTHMRLRQAQEQLINKDMVANLIHLVTGVAHELNTPLGVCTTAASHLEMILSTFEQVVSGHSMSQNQFSSQLKQCRKAMALLTSNLNRTSDQVDKFKAIAGDQLYQVPRRFNLNNYLVDWLTYIKPELKQQNIDLQVNLSDNEVYAPPGVIASLLTELVRNSMLHAYPDNKEATITLSITNEGQRICIDYCDWGIGMDNEQLLRLFTPFSTTLRSKGHLGLSAITIYNLVTSKLGGDVKACSPPGQGLCYNIRFTCKADC